MLPGLFLFSYINVSNRSLFSCGPERLLFMVPKRADNSHRPIPVSRADSARRQTAYPLCGICLFPRSAGGCPVIGVAFDRLFKFDIDLTQLESVDGTEVEENALANEVEHLTEIVIG